MLKLCEKTIKKCKLGTAKEIDKLIVNHAFCRKFHKELVRDGSGMREATCLDMVHMEIKNRFLSKVSEKAGVTRSDPRNASTSASTDTKKNGDGE